jgi:hypothetical protein
MGELVNETLDSQYSADVDPLNSSDISIGRFGAFVRSTASSTNSAGSANWVSDLTNNTTNPPYSFAGVISEVIVFDRKLTEVERQNVYGYLARKYRMDSKLPDAFKASHSGVYYSGATYWQIEHHPNTQGLSAIPSGVCFANISLRNFLSLPQQTYRSIGSPLVDGTTLSGDTYNNIGL